MKWRGNYCVVALRVSCCCCRGISLWIHNCCEERVFQTKALTRDHNIAYTAANAIRLAPQPRARARNSYASIERPLMAINRSAIMHCTSRIVLRAVTTGRRRNNGPYTAPLLYRYRGKFQKCVRTLHRSNTTVAAAVIPYTYNTYTIFILFTASKLRSVYRSRR
jgi:hypothetical protein